MNVLRRLTPAVALVLVSLSFGIAAIPEPGVASYRVDVMTTAPSGAAALGVNQAGDVVGWQAVDGNPRAFFWREGVVTLLPLPQDLTLSIARDVNDTGIVVGSAYTSTLDEPGHAMRWTWSSEGVWTVQDLGVLPGDSVSEARGVNNLGQIVGHSNRGSLPLDHGFLHTEDAGLTSLNAASSAFAAYGVNDSGMAVGTDASNAQRVDIVTDAAQLLGGIPPYGSSHAYGINAQGQVAGALTTAGGNCQVVARYADPTGWQILGGLGETNLGWGINSAGTVVGEGWARTGSLPSKRAVIFLNPVGALLYIDDLLEPGGEWSIYNAYDINDAGQIAGHAINTRTGRHAAVRLSPAGGIVPISTPPPSPATSTPVR
jgi:probable HAF family extracellular repeat protein